MRSRVSVTHLTTPTQTPPPVAASTKSKKQPAPAVQPSGKAATDNEENE